MLSIAQQKELAARLTTSKWKTLRNLEDSEIELAKANFNIAITHDHLDNVNNAIAKGRVISKEIENSAKPSYIDILTSAFAWVMANPTQTALTIGGGVTIAAGVWAYNKYSRDTNPTISTPTTTNITINNITKAMEDI